jgi:hypothetical protein
MCLTHTQHTDMNGRPSHPPCLLMPVRRNFSGAYLHKYLCIHRVFSAPDFLRCVFTYVLVHPCLCVSWELSDALLPPRTLLRGTLLEGRGLRLAFDSDRDGWEAAAFHRVMGDCSPRRRTHAPRGAYGQMRKCAR